MAKLIVTLVAVVMAAQQSGACFEWMTSCPAVEFVATTDVKTVGLDLIDAACIESDTSIPEAGQTRQSFIILLQYCI